MRGVDEETLLAVRKSLAAEGLNTDAVDALISLKIRELNPWLPIDENTPKDRELLLFFPERSEFNLTANKQIAICNDSYLNHCFLKPTHYQELPDDPGTGDKNG